MAQLRMIVRTVLVLSWTVIAFGIRLLGLSVAPVAPDADRRWRRAMFKLWGKVSARIIGMRVEVQGTAPTPPYVQVSNHLSYLDTALMAGQLGCVFVAKSEMAHWPLFGLLARRLNTIFIDREHFKDTVRVNRLIGQALDRGEGLHVFAESTTSQGAEVRRFKPALLEPAIERGCPVHYVAITYRTPEGCPPAAEVVCWWTKISLVAHAVRLFRLPYFEATLRFGEAPVRADDRKELADRLHAAVQAIFVPVAQGEKTMEKALAEGLPNGSSPR